MAANEHIAGLRNDAYFLGDLHAVASGGSSGVRGVFVWDWDGWAVVRLVALRQQLKDRLSDPELASKMPIGMVVAANNATHFTTASAETFATEAAPIHRLPIGMPLAEIVAGLNEVDGDGLATYPSMLSALVSEANAGRLTIRPKRILTMAEPLFDEIREGAERTWDAPVANMWGTSEAGIVGIGCFLEPGMHLADDLVIVEAVDANGRPVPPGVRSNKVFVTNLANTLQPLIRYEITDQVTFLDERCRCGSAHRRVADIQGRLDDDFAYANGLHIHPHVFRSALVRESAVTEYQVRQSARGAEILLRAEGPVDTAALADRVADALRALGLADPEVSARTVDLIPRLASGKLKRFIPRAEAAPRSDLRDQVLDVCGLARRFDVGQGPLASFGDAVVALGELTGSELGELVHVQAEWRHPVRIVLVGRGHDRLGQRLELGHPLLDDVPHGVVLGHQATRR